jgi:acetyl-CoA acetyltransferase
VLCASNLVLYSLYSYILCVRIIVTREQLAMVSVLMSRQAVSHPYALTKKPRTLEEVLASPQIGAVTNLLECARRADGGAAIVIASSRFIKRHNLDDIHAPVILGGGEASGPLYPPRVVDESMFSCDEACQFA